MQTLSLSFTQHTIALLVLNIVFRISVSDHFLYFFERRMEAITFILPPEKPKSKELSIPYYLKTKKRLDIYLTRQHEGYNSEPFDQLRMNFIFRELQRISFGCQNDEIVIVHFNEGCTIGDWVELVDLATTVRLKRYTFWNDALYFFGNEKASE